MPAYLNHWDERFGSAFSARRQNVIWVHAVSVGETRAAMPLVQALQKQWPDAPLLITQMTPTGRACAETLYGEKAEIRYLPYDYPHAVRDFLQAYQPKFGILMETELWPNLLSQAHRLSIPLFLVNARLSEKSYLGYRRVLPLIRPALRQLTAIAAQAAQDAARLVSLGAIDPQVCGNTKYDFLPPPDQAVLGMTFKQRLGERLIWVCASTREQEEDLILGAWRAQQSQALLVIVPRHPERFDEVASLVKKHGFKMQRRSDQQPVLPDTSVWIGDSMGEMFAYYHVANLVFIGGSLVPLGGQNLIEPASIGKPVLMGPSCFNFADVSQKAFDCGAARQVADADQLVDVVNFLLGDSAKRQEMGQAGLTFSQVHRGASQRIVELIRSHLTA